MKSHKIFVLEDDIVITTIYRDFFLAFDYEIDFYSNYDDAYEAIKEKGVDHWGIFIIDLKIPKNKNNKEQNNDIMFYGYDFIEKFLPLERTILITGYMSPELEVTLSNLKILMYFIKPVSLFRLLTLINAFFNYFYDKGVTANGYQQG